MAYPYGSYRLEQLPHLRDLGYRLGFTVEEGWVRPGDDPMQLKRLAIFPWHDLARFRRLLVPTEDK